MTKSHDPSYIFDVVLLNLFCIFFHYNQLGGTRG